MKYQLWHSESERSGLLLLHEEEQWSSKAPDAQVIWTVEANTYNEEALQKRDGFLKRAGSAFASLRAGTFK